jgi:RNA polymerase sigma-70 factor, ECF subfamily
MRYIIERYNKYNGEIVDKDQEKKLVEASRNNPNAFGELFEAYFPQILKYTMFRTGNAETARDITAETFYRALKNLWKFRWMGTTFLAWLYRIAGNLTADYFRGKKFEPLSLDEELEKNRHSEPRSGQDLEQEIMDAQEQLDSNLSYAQVKERLLSLPANYQEVLVLRYFESRKIGEICEILGKKEGTVKSLISRGVSLLRQLIKEETGINAAARDRGAAGRNH